MAAKKKTAKKKTTAKKTTAKKKTTKKKTTKKKTTKKKTTAKAAPTSVPPVGPALAPAVRLREMMLAHALGLPGAWEDHPWGETVAKVGKKVFVFFGMGTEDALREGVGMSVKLPQSGDLVLALPFAEPTGYGLGRAGWVSVRFPIDEAPPVSALASWIEESYRAVAPRKQVALLDARAPGESSM